MEFGTSSTREAVQKLGNEVRKAKEHVKLYGGANRQEGFVQGIAKLAALMCETIPTEEQRRAFLKDCGFDGEEVVG